MDKIFDLFYKLFDKWFKRDIRNKALLLNDAAVCDLIWGRENYPLLHQWRAEGKLLQVFDGEKLRTPRIFVEQAVQELIDSNIKYRRVE